MLKLPKGLKKKKKGKKSKKDKDQDLFTPEELEKYRREHQQQQAQPTDGPHESTSKDAATAEDDDQWSQFNQIAKGIDSVLHQTQDDLDRIKSTSFFQRVPLKSELDEEKRRHQEAEKARLEEEARQKAAAEAAKAEEDKKDHLAQAVIELSESEEEESDADDIFATDYIDEINKGNLPLAYIPDSPEEDEFATGDDPFDTSYADKVIRGPEVSSRGKKLVNIGSAVQVLTGRVETVGPISGIRRPRRGIQNLLLDENEAVDLFEEPTSTATSSAAVPEPTRNLLDDLDDNFDAGAPIDLSVSLHLQFQKQEPTEQSEPNDQFNVEEFDVLAQKNQEEDDEFGELAAESLTKHPEEKSLNLSNPCGQIEGNFSTDWAEFEGIPEQKDTDIIDVDDLDTEVPYDDPFDTTFVVRVLPTTAVEDDDFDPRAEDEPAEAAPLEVDPFATPPEGQINLEVNFPKSPVDLLAGSCTDLSQLPIELAPIQKTTESPEADFDPFDTSIVSNLVQPKGTELKFLEKELLEKSSNLHHSLSDPDFDPRAEEPLESFEKQTDSEIRGLTQEQLARRKSSLSLRIQGINLNQQTNRSVAFAVPTPDLLKLDDQNVHQHQQKPLTPYYREASFKEQEASLQEEADIDPFDTSFVGEQKPTEIELHLLERDLLQQPVGIKPSISDSDFNPRAETPQPIKRDLLCADQQLDIKVLTPATESAPKQSIEDIYGDPFDTSTVDTNILPGKAELKQIENELLPEAHTSDTNQLAVIDALTDSQELGLGDKVLTPNIETFKEEQPVEIDPFDTSIAENLAPSRAEIKVLETELIDGN